MDKTRCDLCNCTFLMSSLYLHNKSKKHRKNLGEKLEPKIQLASHSYNDKEEVREVLKQIFRKTNYGDDLSPEHFQQAKEIFEFYKNLRGITRIQKNADDAHYVKHQFIVFTEDSDTPIRIHKTLYNK